MMSVEVSNVPVPVLRNSILLDHSAIDFSLDDRMGQSSPNSAICLLQLYCSREIVPWRGTHVIDRVSPQPVHIFSSSPS